MGVVVTITHSQIIKTTDFYLCDEVRAPIVGLETAERDFRFTGFYFRVFYTPSQFCNTDCGITKEEKSKSYGTEIFGFATRYYNFFNSKTVWVISAEPEEPGEPEKP